MGELKSEHAIINHFQSLKREVEALAEKVNEMVAEAQEHALVLKALEPLDRQRKCHRLVGEVLMVRTVGEVVPTVSKQKEQLEQLVETLTAQCKAKQQDLIGFQQKYKIRVKGEQEPMERAVVASKPTSQDVPI